MVTESMSGLFFVGRVRWRRFGFLAGFAVVLPRPVADGFVLGADLVVVLLQFGLFGQSDGFAQRPGFVGVVHVLVRWASTYSSSFRRMSVSPVVFLAAAILCLRRGLRLLDGGVLCFGLRCRLAVELLQVRVAGCGILVCHVRLVCDAEDFGGFAFRRGYDDLEAEARQHGQRASCSVRRLDEASSRNSVV